MIKIVDNTDYKKIDLGSLVKNENGSVGMVIRVLPMYVRVLVFKEDGYKSHRDAIYFWKIKDIQPFNGEVILKNE